MRALSLALEGKKVTERTNVMRIPVKMPQTLPARQGAGAV